MPWKYFWLTMYFLMLHKYPFKGREKVNFRSQILVRPSIGEYWNTFGVPVLPENVIFTFFRMCWCYSEAYNTGTQKWFSIVQYSCTSIWDFKYTISKGRGSQIYKKTVSIKLLPPILATKLWWPPSPIHLTP